jgi:vanillate O-demethylase ferredoxin subunit
MLDVLVQSKREEAQGICAFELAAADGVKLPPFEAGAHIDVHLGEGLVRQYSLCPPPHQAGVYVIGVLREPASRGGSVAMHALQVGSMLRISEPRNHFPLAHDARRSVLFAGGIGITPILCMAERLAAIGEVFELHYCARSRARAAFVERIQGSSLAAHTALHFDEGAESQKLDVAQALGRPQPGTHVYVCGPAGFMDWVLSTARGLQWPEAQLHREYFSAPAHPAVTAGEVEFEVQIASTGAVYAVPTNRSVIAVLVERGIDVPVSCEQGVCGTCLTRVLQGTPDHRDVYLTPEEQAKGDQFTPCCSRAKSARLVLDL